jgi:hypothetical protein
MRNALRPLVLVSIVGAVVPSIPAAATPVTPSPVAEGFPPLVHSVQTGRKGTRNYRLDGGAPDVQMQDMTPRTAAPSGEAELKACLDLWDPETHMSKGEWKSSCVRVLRQRSTQPEM